MTIDYAGSRGRSTHRWLVASTGLLFTTLLLLFASDVQAQGSIGVEGRAGVTFPQGDLSDAGAESGLSFGVEVLAGIQRNLTAYVGAHRHAFNCEDACRLRLGNNPTSTGVGAGLKYIVQSPGDVLTWVRGGVIAQTLESETRSSSREIGFELGIGADLPVAPRFYLVPNLGFLSHDGGGGVTASFFTFGLGAHYHLR
jgi:hypothetical protein